MQEAFHSAIAESALDAVHGVLYENGTQLIINVKPGLQFIMNSVLGAWQTFTGIPIECSAQQDGNLYFGAADGNGLLV